MVKSSTNVRFRDGEKSPPESSGRDGLFWEEAGYKQSEHEHHTQHGYRPLITCTFVLAGGTMSHLQPTFKFQGLNEAFQKRSSSSPSVCDLRGCKLRLISE